MSQQAEAHLRRAQAARAAGRAAEAAEAYEALLEIRPDLSDSWFNLALMRRAAGRPEAALDAYAKALARRVSGPEEAHLNRAVILSDDLGRPQDAEAELLRALALRPDWVPALLNLGNLHEDRGERDAARATYARALDRAGPQERALVLARLANASRFKTPDDPLIDRLRQVLAASVGATDRAELGFALGRALDEAGAYDAAFDAYSAANAEARRSTGARYDRAAQEAFVGRAIAAFDRAETGGGGDRPPVFILGMFRSGSTLVERILAAHSGVVSGGELGLLPGLVRRMADYPEAAAAADPGKLEAWRQAYLDGVRTARGASGLVTDKRPDNFLHVGLIKRLFPDARIIHTVRDARDVCLSNFFLHLDPSMAWAMDLEDAAHWLGQHDRLTAHWKTLYPDILTVRYDDLVGDFEAQARRILDYCGLAWEAGVSDFHSAAGAVRTASVWQVREPIYQRSAGRWRNYEARIGKLIDALG
ncbi:sulfotransferase [Brevundimonas sp. VNH65]|uniref:tetratricopeptide repeat-containing sulfotransferase family protein n=1 Tax=Brevundimonas sp. VNH65 TaxID=3400917 RepID=UPI003C0DC2A8